MIGRILHQCGRLQRRGRYEIAKRIMPHTSVLGPKIVPRIEGPLSELREVKLNLGCGPMHLDGYINIDAAPDACADFYMDFGEIGSAFADDSLAEVLMVHSIAYLNLWQTRELLATLLRLLRSGGRLVIETPDIEKCAAKLMESSGNFDGYLEGVRGIYAFDPTQVVNKSPITPYSFGWSPWHLRRELSQAGFRHVETLQPAFHGQFWRDFRMEAIK